MVVAEIRATCNTFTAKASAAVLGCLLVYLTSLAAMGGEVRHKKQAEDRGQRAPIERAPDTAPRGVRGPFNFKQKKEGGAQWHATSRRTAVEPGGRL